MSVNGHARAIAKIDLHALEHCYQDVAVTRLEKILREHGFTEHANAGTSHRHFNNEEFGIRCMLVQVHGSNKAIDTNREVARACKKVRAEWAKQELAALQTSQQAVPEKISTSSPLAALIPSSLEIVQMADQENVVILRYKDARHLGLLATPQSTQTQVDHWTSILEGRRQRFESDLAAGSELFEVESFTDEAGNLAVRQTTYNQVETFEPYDPAQINPRTKLDTFFQMVEEVDRNTRPLIDSFREKARREETADGKILWTNGTTHAISNAKKLLTLTTSPQLRMAFEEMARYQDELYEFQYGTFGDKKFFRDLVKRHGGFNVARENIEGKGPRLVVTHPFYPDCRIIAPMFHELPPLRIAWIKYTTTQCEGLDPEELQRTMDEVGLHRAEVIEEANHAITQILAMLRGTIMDDVRKSSEARTAIRAAGYKGNGDACLRIPGEMGIIHYKHPGMKEDVRVHALAIGEKDYLFHPQDRAHMEEVAAAKNQKTIFQMAEGGRPQSFSLMGLDIQPGTGLTLRLDSPLL